MIEICLVTKDGITRQAYNGREMDDETAQWFVSRADYGRVVVQLQAAELKVKELERECSGLELLRREEQLARHEAQDRAEKAEAKLTEYLSYTPKVPTQPYERDLAERLLKAEKERDELKAKIFSLELNRTEMFAAERLCDNQKLQRAREGLEFYAQQTNLYGERSSQFNSDAENYRILDDKGKLARQVLTEIEEK